MKAVSYKNLQYFDCFRLIDFWSNILPYVKTKGDKRASADNKCINIFAS